VKLAYVLGTFPSVSETFILREIVELRRRGVEIIIFALRRPGGWRINDAPGDLLASTCYRPPIMSAVVMAALAHFAVRHPVRMVRILGRALALAPQAPIEMLKCLRNVPAAAFFARRAARFDVRHVHGHFAFMPTDIAWMMAELLGVGFSFSAHASDIYLQSPELLARKIRSARFVAVCTRYGLDEIGRRLGATTPANVHLVYHGISPASPEPAGATDAPAVGKPMILGVGRLQPKKGFTTLIEACRHLRERGVPFRCVIAGEGPERVTLEAAIARHRLQDAILLTGEQTQEQVAALLRTARVFALPCIIAPDGDRDSLPNAILEALAAGVPVVTTPVAGIPEAIEDGRTGLLAPPGDDEGLAARIEELLKNEALCQTIGAAGRAAIATRFDIRQNMTPLAALFEQVERAT
jgi:glycosyltransferase involved in cell wall biosynthesis